MNDRILLLFQLLLLNCDDFTEHLVLQTVHGNGEVDQGDLNADVWKVVWVAELRADEEPELRVVWNLRLGRKVDLWAAAFRAENLSVQQRVQGRVQGLGHVIAQNGSATANRHVDRAHVRAVSQLDHLKRTLLLRSNSDPLRSLPLRVDEQGPPTWRVRHRDDDRVLGGRFVGGQRANLPVENFHRVAQCIHEGEILVHVKVVSFRRLHPRTDQTLAESGCERTEVRNTCSGEEHINRQCANALAQALDVVFPANCLVLERPRQRLGVDQSLAAHVHFVFEKLLAARAFVEALLKRRELIFDRFQCRFRLLQTLVGDGEFRAGFFECLPLRLDDLGNFEVLDHGKDPHADAFARFRSARAADFGGEDRLFLDQFARLRDHLRLDGILVVSLELFQQTSVAEELACSLPLHVARPPIDLRLVGFEENHE
mmetsp:Transcript_42687/g.131842  ORF Transcript_42687/g.131842 Transcript_42687/m.131842 type:complete len:428 (+) Transcript_42687:372-1655(+)